jgi:hypothetical protein
LDEEICDDFDAKASDGHAEQSNEYAPTSLPKAPHANDQADVSREQDEGVAAPVVKVSVEPPH